MAIHTPRTKEQRQFLTNVERAGFVGVTTKTAQAVRTALLAGLSYCNFGHCVVNLTDKYLVEIQDYLWEKAYEAGKDEEIKWVGFEGL